MEEGGRRKSATILALILLFVLSILDNRIGSIGCDLIV